jgi:hypothetical protein
MYCIDLMGFARNGHERPAAPSARSSAPDRPRRGAELPAKGARKMALIGEPCFEGNV